jgi:hypothetical protein
MIMAITIIVVLCLAAGFATGFMCGRLPKAPAFYRTRDLPSAVLLEKVRDRRADISMLRRF